MSDATTATTRTPAFVFVAEDTSGGKAKKKTTKAAKGRTGSRAQGKAAKKTKKKKTKAAKAAKGVEARREGSGDDVAWDQYKTFAEASRKLDGINPASIRKCSQGKQTSARGWMFRYADASKRPSEDEAKRAAAAYKVAAAAAKEAGKKAGKWKKTAKKKRDAPAALALAKRKRDTTYVIVDGVFVPSKAVGAKKKSKHAYDAETEAQHEARRLRVRIAKDARLVRVLLLQRFKPHAVPAHTALMDQAEDVVKIISRKSFLLEAVVGVGNVIIMDTSVKGQVWSRDCSRPDRYMSESAKSGGQGANLCRGAFYKFKADRSGVDDNTGRWLTIDLSAPPGGNTVDRENVMFTVKMWNGGEVIRIFTFNGKVTEAVAQQMVHDFCGDAVAIVEYAAGGDGSGCDAMRMDSWINIDRPRGSRLSLPRHLNLGAGTSFTMGGSLAPSLFGTNPLFWMGLASISLISPRLFDVPNPHIHPRFGPQPRLAIRASAEGMALRMVEVTSRRISDECLDVQRLYNLFMVLRDVILSPAGAAAVAALPVLPAAVVVRSDFEVKELTAQGKVKKLMVRELKAVLKAKGQNTKGNKAELVERVEVFFG